MLAYYLEWHLRKAWAPLLFMDEDPKLADDPVTQAMRSAEVVRKAQLRRTKFGDAAHSFRTLIEHLCAANAYDDDHSRPRSCYKFTEPTPLQARAFDYARTAPASQTATSHVNDAKNLAGISLFARITEGSYGLSTARSTATPSLRTGNSPRKRW